MPRKYFFFPTLVLNRTCNKWLQYNLTDRKGGHPTNIGVLNLFVYENPTTFSSIAKIRVVLMYLHIYYCSYQTTCLHDDLCAFQKGVGCSEWRWGPHTRTQTHCQDCQLYSGQWSICMFIKCVWLWASLCVFILMWWVVMFLKWVLYS